MKVAAPFTTNKKWRDIPDEYNLVYTKTSKIERLEEFCKFDLEKRINVCFQDVNIPIHDLVKLAQEYSNLYIRVLPSQIKEAMLLKQEGVKFFFDVSMPCYSNGILDFLIQTGVTDIYIYDALWYTLPQVSKKCKENNVNIRLILNRIPSLRPDAGRDYCAPIFSPKDMDYLNQYVDTGEFDCYIGDKNEAYNWHKFNVYYKAWFINKTWFGYLDEINIELKLPIPVLSLPNNFIKRRSECGRRCTFNNRCTHCKDYINLANKLHSIGIYFEDGQKIENNIE